MCGKDVCITDDGSVRCIEAPILDIENNLKDALLQSLYGQLDFMKNEIEEKNMLIRRELLRRVNEVLTKKIRNRPSSHRLS